jgi:hypothetical protein
MNLDQQKPTQTRDPGAQWQQRKRSRKSKASEGKREESVPACETPKGKERNGRGKELGLDGSSGFVAAGRFFLLLRQ